MNILNQLSGFPQVRAYVETRPRSFDSIDGDIAVALETLGRYQLNEPIPEGVAVDLGHLIRIEAARQSFDKDLPVSVADDDFGKALVSTSTQQAPELAFRVIASGNPRLDRLAYAIRDLELHRFDEHILLEAAESGLTTENVDKAMMMVIAQMQRGYRASQVARFFGDSVSDHSGLRIMFRHYARVTYRTVNEALSASMHKKYLTMINDGILDIEGMPSEMPIVRVVEADDEEIYRHSDALQDVLDGLAEHYDRVSADPKFQPDHFSVPDISFGAIKTLRAFGVMREFAMGKTLLTADGVTIGADFYANAETHWFFTPRGVQLLEWVSSRLKNEQAHRHGRIDDIAAFEMPKPLYERKEGQFSSELKADGSMTITFEDQEDDWGRSESFQYNPVLTPSGDALLECYGAGYGVEYGGYHHGKIAWPSDAHILDRVAHNYRFSIVETLFRQSIEDLRHSMDSHTSALSRHEDVDGKISELVALIPQTERIIRASGRRGKITGMPEEKIDSPMGVLRVVAHAGGKYRICASRAASVRRQVATFDAEGAWRIVDADGIVGDYADAESKEKAFWGTYGTKSDINQADRARILREVIAAYLEKRPAAHHEYRYGRLRDEVEEARLELTKARQDLSGWEANLQRKHEKCREMLGFLKIGRPDTDLFVPIVGDLDCSPIAPEHVEAQPRRERRRAGRFL